jgi:hypothetical protein
MSTEKESMDWDECFMKLYIMDIEMTDNMIIDDKDDNCIYCHNNKNKRKRSRYLYGSS